MAAFVDNISICAHARPDHGNKNDNHVTNQELCFNQWVTVVIYSYRTWPTSPSDWRLCAADDTASDPSVLRIQTAPDVFKQTQQSLTMAASLKKKPASAPQKIDLLSL